jgi:hypothetical protein
VQQGIQGKPFIKAYKRYWQWIIALFTSTVKAIQNPVEKWGM